MYQYNSHQYYASFTPQFDNNDKTYLGAVENFNYYNNSKDYSNYYHNQSNFQYYSSPSDYQYDTTNSSLGYYSNNSYNNSSLTPISNFNQSPISTIASNDSRVYSQSTPVLTEHATTTETEKSAEIKGGRNLDIELSKFIIWFNLK